jgi:hypothetical protein
MKKDINISVKKNTREGGCFQERDGEYLYFARV